MYIQYKYFDKQIRLCNLLGEEVEVVVPGDVRLSTTDLREVTYEAVCENIGDHGGFMCDEWNATGPDRQTLFDVRDRIRFSDENARGVEKKVREAIRENKVEDAFGMTVTRVHAVEAGPRTDGGGRRVPGNEG